MSEVHFGRQPSFRKLEPYREQIEELLREYGDILIPRLAEYEVELRCFPVEILNEIRAIYAHLYRASVSETETGIGGNIAKAKSHSKRAVLDCYKYLCVAHDDRYHEFLRKYRYVNWSKSGLADKVVELSNLRCKAVEILRIAKALESTQEESAEKNDPTEYTQKYEEAYKTYSRLNQKVHELENLMNLNSLRIVSHASNWLVGAVGAGGIVIGMLLGLLI